jgi:small GTP-binding protein
MSGDDYDFLWKVIITGDSGVGKTSVIQRYIKNTFNDNSKPTIGVELNTKLIDHCDVNSKLQVWDTAGQERFRGVAASYYKGASGVLMVYDISKKSSFENLQHWLTEISNNGSENIIKVICGNKKDLYDERAVLTEDGQRFARRNDCAFMETSALDNGGQEIEQAF